MSEHEEVHEQETQETTGQDDAARAEVEARARDRGWAPKDEWRGDPEKWVDADEFVQRSDDRPAYLRADNERLDQANAALRQQVTEVQGTIKDQGELIRELLGQQKTIAQQAYDRARRDIEREMDAAVEAGDTDGYKAKKAELQELDSQRPEPAKAEPEKPDDGNKGGEPPRPDLETEGWIRDNPWFSNDALLNEAAIRFEPLVARENPNFTTRERLDEVAKRVRQMYPKRFENPRRREPAAVSPTSPPPRSGGEKKHTVADLPDEAREQMAKIIALTPGYTEQEYLDAYQWED